MHFPSHIPSSAEIDTYTDLDRLQGVRDLDGDRALQITLVRHGKPDVEPNDRILPNPVAFAEEYNRAGIDPLQPPPKHVRELAAGSTYVLSSNLP